MPWNMQTLALPASPPSVRLARDWVTGVLVEIGREELADSARLAVSELVTNAILHADPPMSVHVRGTVAHPRIEVTDQSLVPPRQGDERVEVDPDDEFSWTTGGRGLDLVASYAHAWGADIDPRGFGKVVWFEPAAEPQDTPAEGALFDLDEAIAALGGAPLDPADMVAIELLNLPPELFSHLRMHFNELGRELRLLSISAPDRYPIASEFAEAYLQVEQERRQVIGLDVLDAAMRDGVERVDLTYAAPPSAPASMARISHLLEEVYDTLTGEALLAMRPPPTLIALQRWYLGEFVRQGAGERPLPWQGPTTLAAHQEVS
ncbi:MAG: ATP-binding region, ATPase domain protein [Marmoricola sp.]|nr:ATP-binding region, ATPase domain protein [Marmoricola sp.]